MVPELNGQGADNQVARGQKLPSRERNKSEIYQKFHGRPVKWNKAKLQYYIQNELNWMRSSQYYKQNIFNFTRIPFL